MTAINVQTHSILPTETMDATHNEKYAALKFCFRLMKSMAEAYEMLQKTYEKFILPYKTARR